MVLVLPKDDRPIERKYFNRGAIVRQMKEEGFGDFGKINAHKIDKTLEDFIKRPEAKMANYSEQAEEYFDRAKGLKDEGHPLAQME